MHSNLASRKASESMKPFYSGEERRQSIRKHTDIEALVYHYGAIVAQGIAVDMSDGGLQLKILRDISGGVIKVGKYLDILLKNPATLIAHRWRPSCVVRVNKDTFGVRFINP